MDPAVSRITHPPKTFDDVQNLLCHVVGGFRNKDAVLRNKTVILDNMLNALCHIFTLQSTILAGFTESNCTHTNYLCCAIAAWAQFMDNLERDVIVMSKIQRWAQSLS